MDGKRRARSGQPASRQEGAGARRRRRADHRVDRHRAVPHRQVPRRRARAGDRRRGAGPLPLVARLLRRRHRAGGHPRVRRARRQPGDAAHVPRPRRDGSPHPRGARRRPLHPRREVLRRRHPHRQHGPVRARRCCPPVRSSTPISSAATRGRRWRARSRRTAEPDSLHHRGRRERRGLSASASPMRESSRARLTSSSS